MARTMDSPTLRKLPRPQIQAIAKREFVRAVGKTEEIIRRLLKKHPKGVPIPDSASAALNAASSASPSVSAFATLSTRSQRYLHRNQAKTTEVTENVSASASQSASAQPQPQNPRRGDPHLNSHGPGTLTSVHSDDVQLLYPEGPSNTVPVPVAEQPRNRKVPTAAAAIALAIAVPAVAEPNPVPPSPPADVPVPTPSTTFTNDANTGNAILVAALLNNQMLQPPVAGPSMQPSTSLKDPNPAQGTAAKAPMKRKNLPLPIAGPSKQPSASAALNDDENADDEDEDEEPADEPPYPQTLLEADLQDEADNRSVFSDDPRVEAGPDENMVVDVLRQFTLLVDATPKLKERLAETKHLFKRNHKILDKLVTDARELSMLTEHFEESLMARMKDKRELVDGTNTLQSKQARKLRLEWIREERKKTNEKRWRAANRVHEARGLSPDPWELYDEVASNTPTSLQTTPTSSRSGSPKRTRAESDAEDSDVASDDDARRKRSRS